jgi:hypothetical protein
VGFCRLALRNIVLYWPVLNLTAVVSMKSIVSRGTIIAGMRFALLLATYKIGFPGWPEPNLDSVAGFGASITKRGLAPAPFFISTDLAAPAAVLSLPRFLLPDRITQPEANALSQDETRPLRTPHL